MQDNKNIAICGAIELKNGVAGSNGKPAKEKSGAG